MSGDLVRDLIINQALQDECAILSMAMQEELARRATRLSAQTGALCGANAQGRAAPQRGRGTLELHMAKVILF